MCRISPSEYWFWYAVCNLHLRSGCGPKALPRERKLEELEIE